jgi:hypothetical protein
MIRLIGKKRLVVLAWVLPVVAFGFPRAGQASILEEMAGELRLQPEAECTLLYDTRDATPFGRFHLDPGDPGSGRPGTVSLDVPGGTLTAEWVRDNGAREVDPSTGVPVEPTPLNDNGFDAICALTKGFTPLDPTACGQDIFNSQQSSDPNDPPNPLLPLIMIALTNIVSGQPNPVIGGATVLQGLGGFTQTTIDEILAFEAAHPETSFLIRWFDQLPPYGFGPHTPTVLVPLSADPNDGLPLLPVDLPPELSIPAVTFWTFTGVDRYLTDEQEALLGCGPFYGTRCDREGIGLMRSELSALLQSWPLRDGATGGSWDTTDASEIQPGTVGFSGEPVCTRYEGGMTSILPGCRGPGDPGYEPNVDGTLTGPDSTGTLYDGTYTDMIGRLIPEGRRHPFTKQAWSSSMAVLSWNLLEGLVVFSQDADPANASESEFKPDDPLRHDGCSFANPLACCNPAAMLSITTRAPEEDPSHPPLRHWLWETGAEYRVTEATGDLEGFLGWTLLAFGPEQSRASGAEVGVPFFLSPPDPRPPIPDSPLIVQHPGVDGIPDTEDDNFAGVAYGVVQQMVEIDIKPGSHPNSIDTRSKGVIPVAILSTEGFDALMVDADSVRFGPDEAEKRHKRAHVKDVDHDGDLDLMLHFRTRETGIAPGDNEACLVGETYDGVPLMACDSVRTVPPK